eukprot:GHUV01007552.1.p4 GENE.GHUV01007552.1~~GHUV01007552.1.p4  ORF type:complete len:121 (-),score=28.27 GHUV01007552.1:6-368(-)
MVSALCAQLIYSTAAALLPLLPLALIWCPPHGTVLAATTAAAAKCCSLLHSHSLHQATRPMLKPMLAMNHAPSAQGFTPSSGLAQKYSPCTLMLQFCTLILRAVATAVSAADATAKATHV